MTSPLVSEVLIAATWKRIGSFEPAAMKTLQLKFTKEQQELMGFAFGHSSKLRGEALGLAMFVYLVIAEAFRRSGAKFRTVEADKITRTWESVEQMVASLKEHGRPAAVKHAESTSEPAVFRYIVEALEETEGDEPVALTDDEFWNMLCILQAASECLHDAKKSR